MRSTGRRIIDELMPFVQEALDKRFKALTERIEALENRQEHSEVHAIQLKDLKLPPRPRRKTTVNKKGEPVQSREFLVQRKALQGTVDAELHRLFEADRAARGLGVSQMLDFVLYNFYSQPRLSFENQNEPQDEQDNPGAVEGSDSRS